NGVYMNNTIVSDNPMVLAKPVIDPIADLTAFEDIDRALNLSAVIHDDDTNKADLLIEVNSTYATIVDFNITFNYPNGFNYPSGRNYEIVAINVSDTVFNVNRDVKVNVIAVNDRPQISGLTNIMMNEGQQYVLDVTSHISDIDNALDELIITTNSSYANVVGKNITFYYPQDSGVLYEYVKIVVDDGDLTAHQNITVTIIPEGVLFVLLPIPDKYVFEDEDLIVDMEDYISLGENVSISDLSVEINSSYGVVSGMTLTFNYPNGFNYPSGRTSEYIEVEVTLDDQASETGNFKINVQPVNDAPYLMNEDVNPYIGDEETLFTFSVDYIDIDGSDNPSVDVVIDDMAYSMAYTSGNKNLESEGATYQFSTELFEGTHSFYFQCNDMEGELNSQNNTITYSLTVTGDVVEPPVSNDTDEDGMPDWYEDFYGLDSNDPSDAAIDTDGDNYTNLEEYLGEDGKPGGNDHTNPQNPTDHPIDTTGGEDGGDGKESDESGFWLAIIIAIIVIIIVLSVVGVLVMKRRKRAPQPEYQYPGQAVPPAEAEQVVTPAQDLPFIEGPPVAAQQPVPQETYEQPYEYPPTTEQPVDEGAVAPPPAPPQDQPLEYIAPPPAEQAPYPPQQQLQPAAQAEPPAQYEAEQPPAPPPTETPPPPPPAAQPVQPSEGSVSPKPTPPDEENVN
ncbi:MAG: hypothetical protein KAJ51_07830, partial [Thermoplasmata archaeon]|nr:hypothetical protein [Thermoplasmata archaeon]